MHLICHGPKLGYKPFYQNGRPLTRPDSLPYVFRKLRIHRNLTKRALAEMFSVSERYVSDVENGSRFPSLPYCLKCGELFGANAQWVKNKWAREATHRFTERLMKRLGLDS